LQQDADIGDQADDEVRQAGKAVRAVKTENQAGGDDENAQALSETQKHKT